MAKNLYDELREFMGVKEDGTLPTNEIVERGKKLLKENGESFYENELDDEEDYDEDDCDEDEIDDE